MKIKYIIFTTLFMLFSMNITAQTQYAYWPVSSPTIDLRAIYGENTISTTSPLHDGLDIYGNELPIVTARSGTVKIIIREDNTTVFGQTKGMIIIKVPIVQNPEPKNELHYEYDLYMHIDVFENDFIWIGLNVNAGVQIGTITPFGDHLHFTRLEYFIEEDNAPLLVGYDYAGKNTMNPLSNFSTNLYKDPNMNLPSIEKYTDEPSFIYKRNLYGNYYRLTMEISLGKLQLPEEASSLRDDIVNHKALFEVFIRE